MADEFDDKFDWEGEVLVRTYGSVAVYINRHKGVVIRQEGGAGTDDVIVVLDPRDVGRVADAIMDAVDEINGAKIGERWDEVAERQSISGRLL